MLFHILHQGPDAFTSVVTGTRVMDIAKRQFNWICAGAVGR